MTTTTLTLAPRTDDTTRERDALVFRVFADTLVHNGATVNPADPYASTPRSGFAVSIPGAERKIPASTFTIGTVREYVTDHLADLSGPNVYVGTWVDGEHVYLDVSIVVADLIDAVALGHASGQLAVFDFASFETIRL